ncbi:hypothetical protein FGO68_gene11038 [Halteria grandinella]|uniref:Uncharacterized protein n=1 Tax=Halteria grandinella TaxID=5974 RepID=A0A8J8T5G9_HALGN|nr:hypothetical protein FGO68_gene11038 [Halteria grandinella]
MKGEYELRVAELQSQVEALKLERAQSNLQMNDEGKQVDKKDESRVEVPVQLAEKKSSQNYYLESLMLQNDQIQLEIKKLQQHINKQTVEENKKEEKAGISEHIFDLYIQLKDILKATDYGRELKQMYFKAVKEETSQLLESCLKALLHLLRVAEEEEVSQTAEEPAMRESELTSNKSPESPIKDDLSLRRESLDQDYKRYIKSISDEEESPKRLSNSPPQREEKVLQRVKQDNLKGQYLSIQSAKDQPQQRNGRESQQCRSSKQSVEEKRRFNKTKQNQENVSHNSRPQELPRKSSLKKLAQIPNANEQQYSTNIQIYNDQHQNPFQKPSKPQFQPNYETMERQPDSRLEYYDGPIQSNHRRHSSQSSQASFGVAPARQSKAYQQRVQKQPKGPENLSIQNHGDSSYAALQLAKLHSQIQTPTFEMLSHQENNQRHKFIKTDNIKSINAHGLPSGQVKHRIK